MQTIYNKIVADPKKGCLIVHYDILDSSQSSGKQSFQQIVNIIKPADKCIDLEKVARKILKKCDIIPYLRIYEVIFALIELNKNGSLSPMAYYEFPFSLQNFLSSSNTLIDAVENFDQSVVSIDHLDTYIESLYDELEDKIKASLSILSLVLKPENLSKLSKNDTLLCALSRVFREDGKKSLELAIYITCIFSYFSKYVDFHFAISNYKVGSTCLEMIYFEIIREESWLKELNQKRKLSENQLENLNAKQSYEKLLISYQNLIKKQNIFLKYALYVLLNISEDIKLEYKICNKGIISVLSKLLERSSQELLLIIVIYLKKLSIFRENKIQMKEVNIIKNLTSLLYLDNEVLIYNTMKLIFNLIIDKDTRIYLIRSGMLSKLVSFFIKGNYMSVIASIFYLVSCEPKHITVFNNWPQLVNIILEKILQDVEYKSILCSLIANLATNHNLAQLIIESKDYSEIVKSAFFEKNLSLLRLCRNISCHDDSSFKLSLVNYQNNLIELMLNSIDKSLCLVESIAILTNLSSFQINWLSLYKQYSILDFLLNVFKSGENMKKTSSLTLQFVLLFIGETSHQPELVSYLVDNNIINHILDLINDNQENDNIILNAIYCIYVFVKTCKPLCSKICNQTKLTDYLIELMYDRNYQIKSLCTCTLDLISEGESDFSEKIKFEKFNAYNSKWLNMIQSDRTSDESSHSLLEDMFIYPDLFLKMDILNDSSSENFSDDNQSVEINTQHIKR